jgi:hypothetical protein
MPELEFDDLPGLGVIRLAGPDAWPFLQGQVTADLSRLDPHVSSLAAWCTPQGRVIALMRVAQEAEGLLAVLPRELCKSVAERLGRYVLRARVKVTDASGELAVAGLCGTGAGFVESSPGLSSLRLPAGRECLVGSPERIAKAVAGLRRGSAGAWDSACVAQGEPEVYVATSEAWVPQMLNLDLLGAVGYRKGCYPGQEIVARTQNLGRIKRRLFRYHVAGPLLPGPGAALRLGITRVGEVVRSASTAGVNELLAVVNLEAAGLGLTDETGTVTCSPEPLPYAVPEAESTP